MQKLAESLADAMQSSVLSSFDVGSDTGRFGDVVVLDFRETDHGETADALYGADMLSIYVNVQGQMDDKEESIFLPLSDYELCVKDESVPGTDGNMDGTDDNWKHLEWELSRLVARAVLPPPIPGDKERTVNTAHLTMGANMFFLSLSFPTIQEVEPHVAMICPDTDAMEYRTDLLDCRDSRFDLIYGQQLLRRYCRPHAVRAPGLPFGGTVLDDVMPTVYTVRTQNQAGTYPDDPEGISKMFEMLEWGLRSGAEVVDVEAAWDPIQTNKLLDLAETRYSSQILGSHHVVGEEIETEAAVELFEMCALNGRAHGAKVVLSIESDEKDRMAYEAALIAESLARDEGRPVIPHISLILGPLGQFSRIINIPFTPVTHEMLPVSASPGQMSANEIMAARFRTKIY